jgi:lysophospholipase L1-like esterase
VRRNAFVRALGATLLGAIAGCAGKRSTMSANEPPEPTVDRRALRIVVLGDSLAFGTGASKPTGGFAWRTYEALARTHPGSRVTNYAIGGTTAADVLRLESGRLTGDAADVVIVCVGGNDVLHRIAPESFAGSYERVIAAVRARDPRALVVCCGVPDVALSPIFSSSETAGVERLTHADDDAVRRIAARNGAVFFDLYALTHRERGRTAAFLSADQFHPSDRGHRLIADALVPLVERALQKRRL